MSLELADALFFASSTRKGVGVTRHLILKHLHLIINEICWSSHFLWLSSTKQYHIFVPKMFCYLHFLYYWWELKVFLPNLPPQTNFYLLLYYFCHLLPLFTIFHQLLLSPTNFQQLFIAFHQLLPTPIKFYTSFHQSKMVLLFFFIFFHAPIPPSC